MPEQRIASMMGLREPAAKGAMVSGISAADMALGQGLASLRVGTTITHAFQRPNDSCHA